jgi:protein-glutamine gamma-glutamyltransferase
MTGPPFHRLHKLVAYLYAALGLFALTLGPELRVPVVAALGVAFVASWFAEGPLLERAGYARFWNAAVVAVFVVQGARAFAGAPLLMLGMEYAAFLQISRLFHRRSAREYQHVAILAFLHLISATMLTTDLDYAFVFFGFVVVTPWMLALTHLRAQIEEAGAQPALHSRDLAGGRFLAATALLAVPLFLVTASLFLLIPRVGMGFLSFRSDTGQPVAGFGRNVVLGGFGVIRDDPTVVMRVRVPFEGGRPPDRLALRMRGTSFDRYDGRTWTRTPLRGQALRRMWDRYAIHRWPRPGDRELEVVLDPLDEPVVFLPEGTVAVSVPPRVRGGRDVGRKLVRSPGLDVRYADGDGLRLRYVAHVAQGGLEHGGDLDPEARERYLERPPEHERLAALAREVTAGARTDAERAQRIDRHLRASGRYRYSLHQPEVGEAPPLVGFLFDARRGHCEYFSSAMALMLRSVGVPSRNVTGFVGGRYNPFGDYYAIHHGDAHSWVEAHVDGRWVTFDPTPADRNAMGPREDPLDGVRAFVDAMRTRWATHVVGYDLRDQARAFRRLMRWAKGWRRSSEAPGDDGGTLGTPSAGSPRGMVPWWALAFVLVALAGALVWWWRRARVRGRPEQDDAVRLYLELERALARAGRPRPPAVTPTQHAESLQLEGFPAAPAVREVTDAYLHARFADGTLDSPRRAALRRRIRQVRARRPGAPSAPS